MVSPLRGEWIEIMTFLLLKVGLYRSRLSEASGLKSRPVRAGQLARTSRLSEASGLKYGNYFACRAARRSRLSEASGLKSSVRTFCSCPPPSRLSEARHAAVFARFPGFLFLLRTEQVDWNDVIST